MQKNIPLIVVIISILFAACNRQTARFATETASNFKTANKTAKAAKSISGFIKEAGKNSGKNYIKRQINSGSPVSKGTLQDVIVNSIIDELNKTGELIARKQVIEQAEIIAASLLSSFALDEDNKNEVVQ